MFNNRCVYVPYITYTPYILVADPHLAGAPLKGTQQTTRILCYHAHSDPAQLWTYARFYVHAMLPPSVQMHSFGGVVVVVVLMQLDAIYICSFLSVRLVPVGACLYGNDKIT